MDDTLETEPFKLSVTLHDDEVVAWLRTIPRARLRGEVERALKMGRLALSMTQAGSSSDAMEHYFRPVTERMEELQGALDGILHATEVSQKIGVLGENIVARQLSQAFPHDQFESTRAESHSADLRASFSTDDGRRIAALVEVKLYDRPVPSVELTKFRRDLQVNATRFGLFASLSSRIQRVEQPVLVQEEGGTVIVVLSGAGLDGRMLIWGASLLRTLALFEARAARGRLISAGAVEQAWARLETELDHLRETRSDLASIRTVTRAASASVQKEFDRIADAASAAEARLGVVLANLSARLTEELGHLVNHGSPATLPEPASADEIATFIDMLHRARDRRRGVFQSLAEIVVECELQVGITDTGHWILFKGDVRLAETDGTKTRLDVHVYVADRTSLNIDPTCEEYLRRTGCVVLSGSHPARIRQRLAYWFAPTSHRA
jgi:hypothetical protein